MKQSNGKTLGMEVLFFVANYIRQDLICFLNPLEFCKEWNISRSMERKGPDYCQWLADCE